MNVEAINNMMYYMTKQDASDSWVDFLEDCECSEEDWGLFKKELEKIGITRTYL